MGTSYDCRDLRHPGLGDHGVATIGAFACILAAAVFQAGLNAALKAERHGVREAARRWCPRAGKEFASSASKTLKLVRVSAAFVHEKNGSAHTRILQTSR